MSLSTTFLLIFAIVTEVAREICFKLAANKAQTGSYFMHLLKTPLMWIGVISITIGVAIVGTRAFSKIGRAYET